MQLGTELEPLLAQADGDAWQGTLPLFVWPTGKVIRDFRVLPRPEAEDLVVRFGVYNWVTGERLPAFLPDGRPLPDDAVIVPVSP